MFGSIQPSSRPSSQLFKILNIRMKSLQFKILFDEVLVVICVKFLPKLIILLPNMFIIHKGAGH